MSFIFSVYSRDAFMETVLPSLNNSDYSITLRKDEFRLRNDIKLQLEVIGNQWKLIGTQDYRILQKTVTLPEAELKDGLILWLRLIGGEQITVIVTEEEQPFRSFRKFSLNGVVTLSIGRDAARDIEFDFKSVVARNHATITSSYGKAIITCHSENGLYVNGKRIIHNKELHFGDYINIVGLHLVYLGEYIAIDTSKKGVNINRAKLREVGVSGDKTELMKDDAGLSASSSKTIYHRAPRPFDSFSTESIEIEPPPQLQRQKKQSLMMTIGPSFTMALPMLLGCILMIYAYSRQGSAGNNLFMYSGLVMAVSSALVGTFWSVANMRNQKKEEARDEELRQQRYGSYLISKTEEIRTRYNDTLRVMNDMYPEPSVCLSYDEEGGMLWNRNRTHPDYLTHRLGVGQVEFPTEIRVPQKRFALEDDPLADKPAAVKADFSILYDAPVTLDLATHHLVGIIGGDSRKGAISVARTLSLQIAASNCYTDVKMAFIYDGETSSDHGEWEFARWLPHVWSEDHKTRFVASDRASASEIFYELSNILRDRVDNKPAFGSADELPKPYYIVFISDQSMLEGEIFTKYMTAMDNAAGLTTVLLAETYEQLPNSCDYIIENTDAFSGGYGVYGSSESKQEIKFDITDSEILEDFARRISSLRVQEIEEGGDLPASLTFFEMLHVNKPAEIKVREHWAKNRTYENIRGQLGEKVGGVPCYLDVHEKYHGPHGLVAGTTGSGKSETLQTYMLSLAVNYSPDDIGFFIIDYKGGGMANLFDGLPHLIGQISNLSGNQVRRAMISIQSENRRRQRIFNENGVNNINNYTKLFKNGEATEAVPHLFIIIDEFAELKRNEPEFMSELISVAQVGRSLGVHLILATQRPSGTVDENIKGNAKFRLCLRVQDRQDSMDMLNKPDAAYITQAGRGYLQVGSDEVYEQFQSGYSGAPYDENEVTELEDIVRMINCYGKVELSGNSLRQNRKKVSKAKEHTQLDAVKEHLAMVAESEGYTSSHKLWLPVLREQIYLDEFRGFNTARFTPDRGWKATGRNLQLNCILGQWDDPSNQSQMPFAMDITSAGNIAVCGSITSGRSTTLQTIAYSLINSYSPEAVNIYAIDFSSKMMTAFEKAPHFGGVMLENDLEKIDKFFNLITSMLNERKTKFRGGNFRQYIQANGPEMPAIVLMIDNYAAFKEKTGEKYEQTMIRLSKEGISNGIYIIVTGSGFGMNDISTRVGENMGTILTLSLPDRYAYADLLHTLQIDILPESGIKGRGLALCEGRVLEYQTALAFEAEDDYKRLEKISDECEVMSGYWTGKRARPIPEIPEKPDWKLFSDLEEYKAMRDSGEYLPVGYNADSAAVYGIPLDRTFCYGVYGNRMSGKTNFLKIAALAALDQKASVCIFDSPDGAMKSFKNNPEVTYCSDENQIFEFFMQLTPEIERRGRRRMELVEQEYDDDEIPAVMSKEFTPYYIFISDLAWFIQLAYDSDKNISGFIETIFTKIGGRSIYFFAALSLENRSSVAGLQAFEIFAGYRKGIHFGGKTYDNTILGFDYLGYKDREKSMKAGIGLLPDIQSEDDPWKIVVPLARGSKKSTP